MEGALAYQSESIIYSPIAMRAAFIAKLVLRQFYPGFSPISPLRYTVSIGTFTPDGTPIREWKMLISVAIHCYLFTDMLSTLHFEQFSSLTNLEARTVARSRVVPMSTAGMALPYHFILEVSIKIRSFLLLGKFSGKTLHYFVILITVCISWSSNHSQVQW